MKDNQKSQDNKLGTAIEILLLISILVSALYLNILRTEIREECRESQFEILDKACENTCTIYHNWRRYQDANTAGEYEVNLNK